MGGCRAGLRERRFVSPAPTPPPLSPPPPPLPFVPLYLRSGVPSAFAGGIGAVGSRRWGSRLSPTKFAPRQRAQTFGFLNGTPTRALSRLCACDAQVIHNHA